VRFLDMVSTRMLGASGFLAHIFNQFLKWNISVDVVATSEVSVSLTVNTDADLTGLLEDVARVAAVECRTGKSIISVICDVSNSSSILSSCFSALAAQNINVQMISQGASKVNISMICDDKEADTAVRALHKAFFG
jgi:aspartate kinase